MKPSHSAIKLAFHGTKAPTSSSALGHADLYTAGHRKSASTTAKNNKQPAQQRGNLEKNKDRSEKQRGICFRVDCFVLPGFACARKTAKDGKTTPIKSDYVCGSRFKNK